MVTISFVMVTISMFSREKEAECIHGVCTTLGSVCKGLYNLNRMLSWLLFQYFLERRKQSVYTVYVHP